jgi:hypothetical protein
LLFAAQLAGAAACPEIRQSLEAVFLIQLPPASDCVVVDEQKLGNRFSAQPIVKTRAFARRPNRCATDPSRTKARN